MTQPEGPAVVVHRSADVALALRAAGPCGVLLLSAPGAAGSLGAAWFQALVARALGAVPPPLPPWALVLDCADAPGLALAALRAGVRCLVLDAASPGFAGVAAAAAEVGGTLLGARPPALDMAAIDPARPADRARLTAWLAGAG